MNQKILILYDYFDPAYKAGGPIRSLVNLVRLTEKEFKLFILTSNRDHDGTVLPVKPNEWIEYASVSQVKYLSKEKSSYSSVKKEILEINPDVIYINGLFSIPFMIYTLFSIRKMGSIKVVIAPRGMLQSGALNIKPFKKKIYLKILKYLFPKADRIKWHATDKQEAEDIQKYSAGSCVVSAHNIPAFDQIVICENKRKLQFVSISLLERKKNHLAFLKALNESVFNEPIVYDIYGPKSDFKYFEELENTVKKLPKNVSVNFKGALHPSQIGETLQKYKFYVLTSFGENFGHSIFEAFNQGIPVIISDQTPWKNLKEKHAGWDVDLNNPGKLKVAVEEAVNTNAETYAVLQKGARKIAENYMAEHDFVREYKQLFSTQ